MLPCREWMLAGSNDRMLFKGGNPEQAHRKACSTDILSTINPTKSNRGQKPTLHYAKVATGLTFGTIYISKHLTYALKTHIQRDVLTWNRT